METTTQSGQQSSAIEKVKSEAEKRFLTQKTMAIELVEKADSITITDETTLSMATQLLSKIKDVEKITEERRKYLKEPYLKAGKAIDEVAKQVLEPLNKALAIGKDKLRDWNAAQEKIRQDANAEIEKSKTLLDKIVAQIMDKSDKCVTPDGCKSLIKSINEKFPAPELFGPYANEAASEKARYINLLNIKHDALEKALAGVAGSTKAIEAMKEAEKKAEEASAESSAQTEEKKEHLKEVVSESTTKSSVRKMHKAMVIDEKKLPRNWMMPNMEAINAHLKTLKEMGTEFPIEIQGVKFYIDETPIIK
ncbi:MAG: hypothetical protein IT212_07425 [Bacteroidia bacterium]|nr:hypothetical protein [Bacteroidia bacterium]